MRPVIRGMAAALLLMSAIPSSAQETITVQWDPNPEPDIAGYVLYAGTQSGVYTASQDVGLTTQRVMTLQPGTYYFAVSAYNIYRQASDLSTEVSTTIVTTPPPVPSWQAVFHNTVSGQVTVWNMARYTMVSGGPFGPGTLDPAWQVRAFADMNADGQKDVILQHLKGGYLAVWIMNGDRMVETRMMNRLADPAWLLVGAADFNADGKTDLVFEHTTKGVLSAWLMNGTSILAGTPITPSVVTDTKWRVIAAADMNGDGKPDLVWQHRGTGRITTWLMNGTTMVSAGPFSTVGPSDPDWEMRGVADVNDDGAPDLLWQHATKGYIAAWLLSGFTVIDVRLLNPPEVSSSWSFVGGR
jgi:hypothetical protein